MTVPHLLSKPALLGTAVSAEVSGSEQLATVLARNYAVHDLEPLAPLLEARPKLQLEAAMASFGEIVITSVLGSPLTMAVSPLRPLAMLAIPSMGWGCYDLDDSQIENVFGETIAYIPPQALRLSNDHTGGTAIQFSLESLEARIKSISSLWVASQVLRPFLRDPFVFDIKDPAHRQPLAALMHALAIVDDSYRYGPGAPDPMLGLDDFILRSIAMLLLPQIPGVKADALLPPDQSSTLRRVVRDLAGWMQANLDRPIQLTELEQRYAYGRRALQLGFKAEFGCGPMQWLRLQRLERALEQFQNPSPGLTVRHVAQACGYGNLASFSRDFRERYGLKASEVLRVEQLKQQHGSRC